MRVRALVLRLILPWSFRNRARSRSWSHLPLGVTITIVAVVAIAAAGGAAGVASVGVVVVGGRRGLDFVGMAHLAMLVDKVVAGELAAAGLAGIILDIHVQGSHFATQQGRCGSHRCSCHW